MSKTIKQNLHGGADLAARLVDHDKSILARMKETSARRSAGDWDNAMPVVDVPVPASVYINCPKVGQLLRQVSRACVSCPCFKGIAQIAWSDEGSIPWPKRYTVLCAHVFERAVTQVVVE